MSAYRYPYIRSIAYLGIYLAFDIPFIGRIHSRRQPKIKGNRSSHIFWKGIQGHIGVKSLRRLYRYSNANIKTYRHL